MFGIGKLISFFKQDLFTGYAPPAYAPAAPDQPEPDLPPPSPARDMAKNALKAMGRENDADACNEADRYLGHIADHKDCNASERDIAGFYRQLCHDGFTAHTAAITMRTTLKVLAAGVSGLQNHAFFDVVDQIIKSPEGPQILAERAAQNEQHWCETARQEAGPAGLVGKCVVGITATGSDVFFGRRGPGNVYATAVAAAGGIPRQLYTVAGGAAEQTAKVDALLLPGGPDINPKLYGEWEKYDAHINTYPSIDFDRFEADCAKYAFKYEVPMLGICRGMQMMNVAGEGQLVQDIPRYHRAPDDRRDSHRIPSYQPAHPIWVYPDTILRTLMGTPEVVVNSNHHQCIDPRNMSKSFNVSAVSPDRVIEGIERKGGKFQIGVQYHPEQARKQDARQQRLFDALTQQGAAYRIERDKIKARVDQPPPRISAWGAYDPEKDRVGVR